MTLPGGVPSPLSCPQCGASLPSADIRLSGTFSCPECSADVRLEIFPALVRGDGPVRAGDALEAENEASCYYHPEKRAAVVCEACGRFLCTLCAIELGGKTLCPTCVELGRSREQLSELVTYRTLYDGVALMLAVLPIFFFIATIFTAPMALYVSIRYWKSPSSLVPRTRLRFVLAILISILQIAGWMLLLGSYMFTPGRGVG